MPEPIADQACTAKSARALGGYARGRDVPGEGVPCTDVVGRIVVVLMDGTLDVISHDGDSFEPGV